ncbi:MAG: hypothetical protein E6G05_08735 [Actinobacteria bacterium]|nr:MAG: hypothetical protein E6G05_08735 [Actinomycetota bacterium]
MRGLGRVIFVAILLLMAGTLNIIYGIAAESNAHFFDGTQYAFSTLHTWGWVGIIVGIIQLTGGISLLGAGAYGRFIGIFAATLGAIESLFEIGGNHPWWALGIFVVCLWVLYGLITFTEDFEAQT